MALSPEQKNRSLRLAGRALARYVKLVRATSSVVAEPADYEARALAHAPFIMAFWHGQFMMLPTLRPADLAINVMVARHGDAEMLGVLLEELGSKLIRGAGAGGRQKDRGGRHALRAALRALEQGENVGMTADVPPGPARIAGEGIVTLARLSGRPIIPFAAATSRYRALKTWSRMTINLPYSKLAFVMGDPIFVPREAGEETIEQHRRAVQDALNRATARAYELAGADPARATPPAARPLDAPPAAPGTGLKVYRAATAAAQPATRVLLNLRERQGKEDAQRRGERFGVASRPRPEGPLVWLHAASVGEANAILPLIEALGAVRHDLAFLLTTGTRTSADVARRRLPAGSIHQYVPFDVPLYVRRFLDHWRPTLAVLTESEIWPNLILEAHARAIPLALVNARMSNRSFGRWRMMSGVSLPLFSRFDVVLAQNEKLARRFGELGARRAITAGNLKIDAPPPPADPDELARLKAALDGRPLFLAASTHDGEEQVIAAAHRLLARRLEGMLTIIAPRHPERGLAVAEHLKSLGLRIAQRSLGEQPTERTEVYVADTLGELGTFYALAQVAFVGGSLVDRGGQNPIEAVRHGACVLTGPHWGNFPDAYRALLRHHGALEVKSADEIAAAVERLTLDETERQRMRTGATNAVAAMTGALQATVEALLALLPVPEGQRRAS